MVPRGATCCEHVVSRSRAVVFVCGGTTQRRLRDFTDARFRIKATPQLLATLVSRRTVTGTCTDAARLSRVLHPVCQVLEFVLAEVLELAALRGCMPHRRRVLTPTDLYLAVALDTELNRLLTPALLASFRTGFARADVDTTVGSFDSSVEDEDVDYAVRFAPGGRRQRSRAWWTDTAKWDYCLSAWMRGLAGDSLMVRAC